MPSFQSHCLRLILNLRRALIDWDAPVDRFRSLLARSARYVKLPPEVEIQPVARDAVASEWLIPPAASPQPIVLYLHGGGFTLGWSNIHRKLVAHLCLAARCKALAVDYRLAPEHPFPAALDDCLAAYRRLLDQGTSPREIVIAGDSAGGNLTLATLLRLRDSAEPLPAAAVCIGPVTDLACTGESFRSDNDATLKAEFVVSTARHYAGNQDLCLPHLSPLYGDLHGLPPLLIHAGGDEILLSDATRLAEKARAAGVDARLAVWPGMWHVWHLFTPFLPEARDAILDIARFIREQTRPEEPDHRQASAH